MVKLACFAAVVLACGVARAGNDCATDDRGQHRPTDELHDLERLAAGATAGPWGNFYCLRGVATYKARILAACTKIVAKKPPAWDGCMVLAASLHERVLGSRDVFEWIAKLPRGPWEVNSSLPDDPLYLFQELGDPRGAALIVATWNDSIAKATQHEHSSEWMADWSGWRQHAADALAVIGGADDKTFLDAQAAATVDSHVRDACLRAGKTIAKRLAATP